MGIYTRRLKKRGSRYFYSGQYLNVKYHSKAIYISRKEARIAEADRIREIDEQARNPKNDIGLKTLITKRLDYLLERKSKIYYKENRLYFKKLLDLTGDISVSEVSKEQIIQALSDYSQDLKKRKKTNQKVNGMIRCLKALFNFGIDLYDLNIKNPVKGVKPYSIDVKTKRIPTNAEIEAVKEICDKPERFLIDFCQETGCRINEALRLEKKDIGEDFIILYTRKSRNSNLTPRKIPKPKCLNRRLRKGKIFYWETTPRFLEKRVKKLKQKRWGWHSLRHKFASEHSHKGTPIFELMSLLGHSSLKTTQNYLQLLSLSNL